jgi:hypothetical protein
MISTIVDAFHLEFSFGLKKKNYANYKNYEIKLSKKKKEF